MNTNKATLLNLSMLAVLVNFFIANPAKTRLHLYKTLRKPSSA